MKRPVQNSKSKNHDTPQFTYEPTRHQPPFPHLNDRASLLATDGNRTLLASISQIKACPAAYSIYGYSAEPCSLFVAYHGALFDLATNCYILGLGYRIYSPSMRRFCSSDSFSPFIADTMNSYSYCNGDPVNYRDPSGHVRLPSWFPGARFFNRQPQTRNRISELASMPQIIKNISSHLSGKSLDNFKNAHPEHSKTIKTQSLTTALKLIKEDRLGKLKTLNTSGVLSKDSKRLKQLNEHYFTNNIMHKDNSNWTKRFSSIKEELLEYEEHLNKRLTQIRT
ncbi:RHS repeat-associated core domain-containing protein [Pseudomonas sp. NPDC089422]|uniref:RHS repeat-associated core domain-containing protein n=1 Tax=Pseudomonas sp. NPDC089422 TaxID=3364466 RepID=UPI0037F49A47